MTTTSSDVLLNQILVTLNAFGERLAVVEADLKTVIRDHTKDLDDHEARIRSLEMVARDAVTTVDLDNLEKDRAARVSEALATADRKANVRIGVIGIVVILVNTAIAFFH